MTPHAHAQPVVIGIDGTPAGLEALGLGRLLAGCLEAPLVLCAVYGYEAVDSGEMVFPPKRQADEWLMGAERRLDDSVPWNSIAQLGSSRAHGLVSLAEAQGAAVLVLGSSRR